MIYLDYAATTPMCQEALDTFHEASKTFFGNPSSLHDIGSAAGEVLEMCRSEISGILNGKKEGVYFTGSGSEANLLGIRSLVYAHKQNGKHLITTAAEHSSVFHLFKQFEDEGFTVTFLPLNEYGQIELADLKKAITPETILASIQHGNPEIGSIQPIHVIGKLLHSNGIIFHSDCVQTFGKIPINIEAYHIDSLSVSSHKIYGPKGVGACYINPAITWRMQLPGTTHEKGFRPGTVNVPGIAAFTTAAQISNERMNMQQTKFLSLRKRLIRGLTAVENQIRVIENPIDQLPQIVGLSAEGAQGHFIMLECNRLGIAISTGSACNTGEQNTARTLLAMGKSTDEAKQLIRLSFGTGTNEQHIDTVITALRSTVPGTTSTLSN
ncbi:IscS subfamily cysteine desulfurase [Virgibacillus siamensis]|uniref:IscS subfamily cysteine desulfurase n=1 Tax=Virgibacillus siamensis TaxID=480071 RepID=UPI00098591FA|nr:IscS subfamily cysteine desulfurase [Virgibacillus siamensis]